MDRNNSDIYKDAHYIISETDDFNLIFDNNITSIIGDEENMPIGTIISFMDTKAPFGYLACNGSVINIADHKKLADFFTDQFGSSNYFGGDGQVTFALPDLNNRFLKGSTDVGKQEEAGLPNITGSVGQNYNGENVNGAWHNWGNKGGGGKGALYLDGNGHSNLSAPNWSSYGDGGLITIDAFSSNKIYGSSETVTPANISVLYCIKER